MNQLTEFQQRAVAAGVHKMLNGETFYTSDMRHLASVLGRHLGGPDWDVMQTMHCMKWGEMDKDLRRLMREKCLELLGLPAEIVDVVATEAPVAEQPPKAPKLAWWRRA